MIYTPLDLLNTDNIIFELQQDYICFSLSII
jgi:hypothetical protein